MRMESQIDSADMDALLTKYMERRLRFALGRFGHRIRQVSVRLAAGPGPQEHSCRIRARLVPVGYVTVEERGPDLFSVIDRAAGRAGRQVARAIARQRDLRIRRDSIRYAA